MKYNNSIFLAIFLIYMPFFAVSAQTTNERIDRLEGMIEDLQDQLIKARQELSRLAAEKDVKKGVVRTKGEDITVSTTGGGIKIESDNGNSFKLGGRIQMDYDFFDDVFSEGGESDSEGEFRRTRLSAIGSVKGIWGYKFTINIKDQDKSADVNTAYIDYLGLKPVTLRMGKFKEPFSLERITSSKWISTIERNMTLDLLGGNLGAGEPEFAGVQLSAYHKDMNHLNWAVGVFDDGSEDQNGKDNYAVTGRVSLTPYFGDNHFMHLGMAYSIRDIEGVVNYQSRLGVHTGQKVKFTGDDTDNRDGVWVDDVKQYGLEAAYVRGAFSLQGEYIDVSADGDRAPTYYPDEKDRAINGACDVDQNNNNNFQSCKDLDFDGYYLQAAWTLTGETRGYKLKGAHFDKIKPNSSLGAWELVMRYEEVNIEDDNQSQDVEAEKWVLGVNWYVNNNIRFMANYIDAEVSRSLVGAGEDDGGDALSLRAQYVF